jgi:hypothetical protein
MKKVETEKAEANLTLIETDVPIGTPLATTCEPSLERWPQTNWSLLPARGVALFPWSRLPIPPSLMFLARLIATMKKFQFLEFAAMTIPVTMIPATTNFPATEKNRLR